MLVEKQVKPYLNEEQFKNNYLLDAVYQNKSKSHNVARSGTNMQGITTSGFLYQEKNIKQEIHGNIVTFKLFRQSY